MRSLFSKIWPEQPAWCLVQWDAFKFIMTIRYKE